MRTKLPFDPPEWSLPFLICALRICRALGGCVR